MHHRYMYFKLSKFLENFILHIYMYQCTVQFKALLTWTNICLCLKNQSTESRTLRIDWLSVSTRLLRESFTHIGSHHFRWSVGLNSISIIHSLGTNCSKLPIVWVAIITRSSDYLKFYNSIISFSRLPGTHLSNYTSSWFIFYKDVSLA